MTEHRVNINGIDVTAYYSDRTVETILVPLLKRLTALQEQKKRRILVMLAAPPGAGKSTLLSFLEKLSGKCEGIHPVQTIGMDGFHRRQEYLQSHYAEKDGERVSLAEIKGAPCTFDLKKLTEGIRKVAAGEETGWPVYDRMLHNPTENAVRVNGEIVLLEGNYLLLDEDGWRELHRYADFTVSIRAGETFLRNRLTDRRIKTGVPEDAAVRFVDFSDMPNVRLCLRKSLPADLELETCADGEYHIL